MHVGGEVQLPINSGGPSKISEEFWETSASSTRLSKNRVRRKAFLSSGLNSEHTYTHKHIAHAHKLGQNLMKLRGHTHHSPHFTVVEDGIKDSEVGQFRLTEATRVLTFDSNAIHRTHTEGRGEQGNLNFCSVRGAGETGGWGEGWTYLTLI